MRTGGKQSEGGRERERGGGSGRGGGGGRREGVGRGEIERDGGEGVEGGKFDEIKTEWLKDRASGLSVCTGSGVFSTLCIQCLHSK